MLFFFRDLVLASTRTRTCMAGLGEEWSDTVFENRILREMPGPKREDVTGEWKQLHDEKI